MSRRCRNCGHRRHRRTVFSQPGFWLMVAVAVMILYAVQTGRA